MSVDINIDLDITGGGIRLLDGPLHLDLQALCVRLDIDIDRIKGCLGRIQLSLSRAAEVLEVRDHPDSDAPDDCAVRHQSLTP